MLKEALKDISFIIKELKAAGLSAVIHPFGSTVMGHNVNQSDIDLVVVVSDSDKIRAVELLRHLGGTLDRKMNWEIDVFNNLEELFGYNSRVPGILHFLVMNREEYEGDSALAVNIRNAAERNSHLKWILDE